MNDTDRLAQSLVDIKYLIAQRNAAEAKVKILRQAIKQFFQAPWWPGNHDVFRQAMKETDDGAERSPNDPAGRNGTDAVDG